MKTVTIYFLVLIAATANAQTINLNYEPNGQIIQFYFDSLSIYTDTSSLFSVYDEKGNLKDYDLRVKNFIRKKVKESNADTIFFSGYFIPFYDSLSNKNQNSWYVEWAILHLLNEQKLKIYDKQGQLVKTIVIKKVGRKKDNFINRSYLNKDTKEELLAETLFIRMINPKF